MGADDYRRALKEGKKEYQYRLQIGQTPTLKSLDSILSHTEILGQESLGLVQIPMDQIAGTKYEGRCMSFAANFMPIMDEESEFGTKWSLLATAHQVEGIHDSIVAVEYLNEFYVVEGNKRVSVMKYFGAAEISGTVTRILPQKSDDKRIKIYYEFVDFYRYAGLHNVVFSKEGQYVKLQAAVGKKPGEVWDTEDKKVFQSVFYQFSTAVVRQNGGQLKHVTMADAFLAFLGIYDYDEIKAISGDALNELIVKSWKEIALLEQVDDVELKMDPTDATVTMFTKLLGKKTLKAAFVYVKTPASSSWTYNHELGRWHVDNRFDGLETISYENVDETNISSVLEDAIKKGCDVIFTTSPIFAEASVKAAIAHPEVKILNCSLNSSHQYIRHYYARLHEAKFILGAVAGAMAHNDRISYVADYPLFGVIAHINAFAYGAKMVNPRAKVYLEWSTLKGVDVNKNIAKVNPACVSGVDMYIPERGKQHFGLFTYDYGKESKNLAMPVYNWGHFYEQLISTIFDGTWKQDETYKSVNYWWGMSANVIDVFYSNNLPEGTIRLLGLLKETIKSGQFKLFSGQLYSQTGLVHNSKEEMEPWEVLSMDWLADNVVGEIPKVEKLTDWARPVIEKQGLPGKKGI
ncbi:MAG: BMP family ABC transporter substrate-binding protein [Lachnospiraceae bacterium]|nr:BMP family ABC transporter substrate-binding protein [Lachnospiraceae bacterium]